MAREKFTHYLYAMCNDDRFRYFIQLDEIVSDDDLDSFSCNLSLYLENISSESITLKTQVIVTGLWSHTDYYDISGTLNPGQSTRLTRMEQNLKYNSIGEYTYPIYCEITQDANNNTPDLHSIIEGEIVCSRGKGVTNYLTEITDADKRALKDGSGVIKTRLIVKAEKNLPEIILTEEDSVKTWDINEERYVPNNGFIGQYVARELSGELQNISDDFNIENRTIQVCMGIVQLGSRFQYLSTESNDIIVTENGDMLIANELPEDITTWYTLGSFIVTEPTDDEVNDNTKFNAMDYTVLLNMDFNPNYVSMTYPQSFTTLIAKGQYPTALWLAKYTCEQANLTFKSTSFTNSDFLITTNQFTGGESCRDVLKAISQLAYGWCRTGWDDGVYIDEPQTNSVVMLDSDTDNFNTITYDDYFSLKTQKNTFGPVNRVVIGMKDVEGENVYVEDIDSITTNGLCELDIWDNPITYTQELRESVKEQARKLLGLCYTPIETETKGDPWLKANEPLIVKDMKNRSKQTFPLNKTIKYSGHIRTPLSSPADTLTYQSTVYNDSLYKNIRDVRIQVNKQDGVINIINSNVQTTNEGLLKLENRVTKEITETYSKTQIQKILSGVGEDGTKVSSVTTTSGTFDENGLTIEKTESTDDSEVKSRTKTNLNSNGMIIYDTRGATEEELLVVNSDGVVGKNITVKTYLIIGGHSRVEDYTHTDGTNGTGAFWVGN